MLGWFTSKRFRSMTEYLKWSNRPITREFSYLQVDTVYIRVRKSSKRKVGTMIVIGITENGYKEVLHFTLGNESARHFDEVLRSLIRRGLNSGAIRLATTDGATAARSMACLCKDREDLFRYFGFPDEYRKTIRNTSLIERVIREVRRRTKVMDSLNNEYGCYGILMGIVREQNERWSMRSNWK